MLREEIEIKKNNLLKYKKEMLKENHASDTKCK